MARLALSTGLLLAAALACVLAAPASAARPVTTMQRAPGRTLLQSGKFVWDREVAAIGATKDAVAQAVEATITGGPAEAIKLAVRGNEIARLASNQAVRPSDFDSPGPRR